MDCAQRTDIVSEPITQSTYKAINHLGSGTKDHSHKSASESHQLNLVLVEATKTNDAQHNPQLN